MFRLWGFSVHRKLQLSFRLYIIIVRVIYISMSTKGLKNMPTYYTRKQKKRNSTEKVIITRSSNVKAKVVYKCNDIIYFINEFDKELLTYLKGKIGWGCGYIALPKTHPWFNKSYDDIKVDIHVGLTYAALSDSQYSDIGLNLWVVGFDTAHYSLTPFKYTKDYVLQETRNLLKHAIDVMG